MNPISTRSSCLLSISEVAWLLGVEESSVCRAIRVGLLPVVRRGRRLLVPAHVLVHLADDDLGDGRLAQRVESGGAE